MNDISMKIENLDETLFQWIESQTTSEDRKALLSLQNITRTCFGNYLYMEIGSHLGGSLQPHLLDEKCSKIISIDPRPLVIKDERREEGYLYHDNSTARMYSLLQKIPDVDISKIVTYEKTAAELTSNDIQQGTSLFFIDGEHTHEAAYSDFRACFNFSNRPSIISFHDCFIVSRGIEKALHFLQEQQIPHKTYYFCKSNVLAIILEPDELIERGFKNSQWIPGLPFENDYTPRFLFEGSFYYD